MFENEWIGLGLLFVVISGGAFLLLQLGSGRRRRVESRLAGDSSTQLDSTPELLLGDLTPALAEQTPMSEQDRTELERELRDAGFYRRTAVMEYAAIRAVLVFAPLLVAVALSLFLEQAQMPAAIIGGVVLSALGFSLPRIYLGYVARARTREVERGLPIALDLMTLGLSAGLTVLASLKRVAVELKNSYPVLAYEMEIVAQQAELRSLEHALLQLADRVRIPEVRNLAMLLVQSERLGTDIGSALLEFSSSFRTTLRQRADAQANKASFWMAFPTVLCLWVAAAIVLVGPIYFEFWHRRNDVYEIFQLRAEKLRKERERREKAFETGPQAMPVPEAAEEPEQ